MRRRLNNAAKADFESLLQLRASPYRFIDLARESSRQRIQAALRFDELRLRFSHQLERLYAESQAASLSASYSRAGERSLDVLIALHTDTVQRLSDYSDLVQRLREPEEDSSKSSSLSAANNASRWRIDDGDVLTTLLKELEGRHAAASETVMEAVVEGSLQRHVVAPYLATRISTQLLLTHHLDLWGKGSSSATSSSSSTSSLAKQNKMTAAAAEQQGEEQKAKGAVLEALPLAAVASSAANEAKLLCDAHYSVVPDIVIRDETDPSGHGRMGGSNGSGRGEEVGEGAGGDGALAVPTSPALLRYVILELVKNALRATVEAHLATTYSPDSPTSSSPSSSPSSSSSSSPSSVGMSPVEVCVRLLHSGPHNESGFSPVASLSVVDGGAGIDQEVAFKALGKLGDISWGDDDDDDDSGDDSNSNSNKNSASHANTATAAAATSATAATSKQGAAATNTEGVLWDRLQDQVSYMPARSPLHGIGVGLALSRLNAVYLGGSLCLLSPPPAAAATDTPSQAALRNGPSVAMDSKFSQRGTAAVFQMALALDGDDESAAREGIPLTVFPEKK